MKRSVGLLCLGLALTHPLPGRAADAAKTGIRIFNCDQQVQSTKRGVCANELSEQDFRLLAPGVSWFYNWHFDTKNIPPAGIKFDFIPMAWGDRPADLAGLQEYLAKAPRKPRVVLAVNEPNLRGQAFIPPQETAALYRKIKDVADRYGLATVGPNMALGSSDHDSIKAMDPIEGKEIVYTFMGPFLKAFFHFEGEANIAATAVHSYQGPGELKWAVDLLHKEFNRPVWVTEYAQWKTGGPDEARKNLMQATDFLERTPYVAGYAWFKERAKDNASISLLSPGGSTLTPLGEAYVGLPVHDADVYYRVPGHLQAENYVAMDKMEINPTQDTNGLAFMGSESADGWLDYNVQVDAAGPYVLKFRVGGAPGQLDVMRGDAVLGKLQTGAQSGWQTVEVPVDLPAGAQKLRVRCAQRSQAINWIEFARR